MKSTKWIKLFFGLSLIGVLFAGGVNYIVDPFNIFHTKFLKEQFQMNERFMKIEYLEGIRISTTLTCLVHQELVQHHRV